MLEKQEQLCVSSSRLVIWQQEPACEQLAVYLGPCPLEGQGDGDSEWTLQLAQVLSLPDFSRPHPKLALAVVEKAAVNAGKWLCCYKSSTRSGCVKLPYSALVFAW